MVVDLKIVFFVRVTRVLRKVQFAHLSHNQRIKMAFKLIHSDCTLKSRQSHWDIIHSEKFGIVNKYVKIVK